MGTSRWSHLWTKKGQSQGDHSEGRQSFRTGVGLVAFVGCLLCLTLAAPCCLRIRRPGGAPLTALTPSQTSFQAAFAEAQRWHLEAQTITKRQLESLEEWDPDSIRGSTPEIYRRTLIARTQEIGRAEAAARQAAHQAQTTQESYRAARLLVHIEHDLGHHRKELEQAEKLVALQPRKPEARLLLERAVAENRRNQPKSGTGALPAARRF